MADLTFGQLAVGLSFNPSGDQTVNDVKQQFADIIDLINNARNLTGDSEVKRLCSIAITDAQTAQMWAVKAVTWGKGQTTTANVQADTDGDSDTETGTTGDETPVAPAEPATPADTATPAASVSDPAPQQPNVGSTPSA